MFHKKKEIYKAYERSNSDREMGKILGIDKQGARYWRRKYSLPIKGVVSNRKITSEKFMEKYSGDSTYKENAVAFGVSKSTIWYWRRKLGISPIHTISGFKLSTEQENKRLNLYKEGLTDSQIAKEVGRSPTTICIWRSRRGLSTRWLRPHEDDYLQFYYEHRDMSFVEIAEHFGHREKYVREQIGLAMMTECRENPDCPWKPLLPEGKNLAMEKRKKS